ncbi:MAG: methyltransferase domain-containing protein [Prevotellaceae bacterium]|jgi:SAM-dependent methyltransferase|nr:methyltransferase domain-containing protein [Prevotellaceae bacterium]
MQYDPIKKSLGEVFNRKPFLRILFYKLLDLLLLRTWHIKRAVRQNFKNETRNALDAGMGFGQYSFYLARKFPKWKIRGVDVKEEQVADCNGFFQKAGLTNAAFALQDLTKLDEKEVYDFILSVDVMEHIEEDDAVFRNFANALRTGGLLLISTPSDKGGSDVHEHSEEGSFVDEHVRDGYNIDAIQAQLRKAGFSKTAAHYSYGFPGKIAWKLSMKYPILLLNASKAFIVLLPFYYLITFPFCLILNAWDLYGTHKTGTGLIVKGVKS